MIRIKSKLANEEGVFAIMTLAFFLACGLSSIIVVWSIAQLSAIYNVAYLSTQAAATAAVGAAQPSSGSGLPGDSIGKGLTISCTLRQDRDCQARSEEGGADSEVYKIAKNSLRTSLQPGTPGNFGLVGPDQFAGGGYPLAINSLRVYNVDPQAAAIARIRGCNYPSDKADAGFIRPYEGASSPSDRTGEMACWRVRENARLVNGTPAPGIQAYPDQYQTGIVLRTRADIPFPSFCASALCPDITISSVAAATQTQTRPPPNYEQFKCYANKFFDDQGFVDENCQWN